MNQTVRIGLFRDVLLSAAGSHFPEFFRERMRLFSLTVMPLLMSFGLIVDHSVWGKNQHDYLPKVHENHWFSVFLETYGILPVVLMALAVVLVVFFAIRLLIRTNKRNRSGKMNNAK